MIRRRLARALLPALCAVPGALSVPAMAAPLSVQVDLAEVHPGPGTHLVTESTITLGQAALMVDGGSDARPAFDNVTVHALWMPQVSDVVTLAFGGRRDIGNSVNLSYAAAGIQAQFTSRLYAEHYLYVSQDGDVTGGVLATLNVPILPQLRLEPRLELGWAAQDIESQQLGHGLTDVTASIRLRHRFAKVFDVYVGAIHEAVVGRSADIARENGSTVRITRAVVGGGFQF
jgi:copper resistance protein B